MGKTRIILDSGALSTLAEKSEALRTALRKIIVSKRTVVLVPTAVIAEATTGHHGLDANVNRALKTTLLVDLDLRIARSAAALRHAHRRRGSGTIDAIVVATADLVPGSDVVTTDPRDISLLASVRGQTRVITLSDVLRL